MRCITYQPHCIYPDVPKIDLDVYEKSLRLFINRFLEDYTGNIAFYQFGKIRTPGVSDLDLLIIVEDEAWKKSRQKAQSLIKSDGLLYFLFAHEPVIVGESILPYLSFLHTLENCNYIQGTWEPLTAISTDFQDKSSSLMRHAMWNSFMRMAALELDNSNIGLRRTLVLMHNLLASAQNGTQFLSNSIPIPLSTEEIRSTILSAVPEKREFLARSYIKNILKILNDVDRSIDDELNISFSPLSSSLPIALNNILLASYRSKLETKTSWVTKILSEQNIKICQVPNYLIYMITMLASQAERKILSLNYILQKFYNPSMEQKIEVTQYLQNITKVINICDRYEIDYFFPLPFAYKINNLSIKSRIALMMREEIARLLFNYHSL